MLAILDPTTWIGRELAALLTDRERLRFFHTGGDDDHRIAEVGGGAALVAALADPDELDGVDAVVLTTPPHPSCTALLLGWLRSNPEVTLVDASQPGLVPEQSTTVLTAASHGGWLHLADPAVAVAAHLLVALMPLALRSAAVTVLRPASSFGPEGVEELVAQAAARLSGRSPRRASALPALLAFDVAITASDDRERLQAQLSALAGGVDVHLSLLDVGMFHGHAVTVAVECAAEPSRRNVLERLRLAPLRLARAGERVRSSAAVDADRITCAPPTIRGRWVVVNVVGDGFRLAGARAVLTVLEALNLS